MAPSSSHSKPALVPPLEDEWGWRDQLLAHRTAHHRKAFDTLWRACPAPMRAAVLVATFRDPDDRALFLQLIRRHPGPVLAETWTTLAEHYRIDRGWGDTTGLATEPHLVRWLGPHVHLTDLARAAGQYRENLERPDYTPAEKRRMHALWIQILGLMAPRLELSPPDQAAWMAVCQATALPPPHAWPVANYAHVHAALVRLDAESAFDWKRTDTRQLAWDQIGWVQAYQERERALARQAHLGQAPACASAPLRPRA